MVDRLDDARTLARYLAEIRRFPLLSRDEERRLVEEIELGLPGALPRLVESNLSFVVKIASEYRSLGIPLEDLINEGNLGLIEAARRFDASKGTKFITYAMWWIRKQILIAVTETAQSVRVPWTHRKKVRDIGKIRVRLRQDLRREPSRAEIADELGVTERTIERTLSRHSETVSIDDATTRPSPRPVADLLESIGVSSEQLLVEQELRSVTAEAFAGLTNRQKAIVTLRFGLGGHPAHTLQEVGERLGLSRERVRQIENTAMDRMRRRVGARHRR